MPAGVADFVLAALLAAAAALLLFGDSSSARAARLANVERRQRVRLTPESAAYVSNALARSRFWRRIGIVTTLVVGLTRVPAVAAWDSIEVAPPMGWLILFAGWFAGLLVAEWRATGTAPRGSRRGADLVRRRIADHVTVSARRRTVAFVAVAVGIGCWLGARLPDHGEVVGATVGLLGGFAAAAGALSVTARRILRRPQAAADDALRAADVALRSRSLQLLAGGAVAGLSWLGAGMLAVVGSTYDPLAGGAFWHNAGGWGVVLAFVGAVAGLETGTQPTPRPASVDVGELVDPPPRADYRKRAGAPSETP